MQQQQAKQFHASSVFFIGNPSKFSASTRDRRVEASTALRNSSRSPGTFFDLRCLHKHSGSDGDERLAQHPRSSAAVNKRAEAVRLLASQTRLPPARLNSIWEACHV